MDNNAQPLFVNIFALIFSSIPMINEYLQTLVLLMSIVISAWTIFKMYKNEKGE